MFRKLINKAIGFYLFPFTFSDRLFYYAKGTFFSGGSENLFQTIRYIKKHTKEERKVVIADVGGYNGGTADYLSRQFKDSTVFCFEPNKGMINKLMETAAKNPKVVIRNIALGQLKSKALFHVTSNNLSSSLNELNKVEIQNTPDGFRQGFDEKETLTVEVSTLDEEFKDVSRLLLIKLDTQGTEINILKGGAETLKKTKLILTELNNHHLYKNTCQYFEVDEFLRNNSFKLVDIIVSYRGEQGVTEYDALYENINIAEKIY